MRQIGKYGLIRIIVLLISPQVMFAQSDNKQLTQTIRGVVTDKASGESLPYATVVITNTQQGTTTNSDGKFILPNVSIGRHTISVHFLGYETAIIKEILVGSAKEVYLEIPLTEKAQQMDEIIITPKINKSESLNNMAVLGVKMLSVEEASRYAGGLDDPARLVTAFAGVMQNSSSNGASNGISIHGNAPSLLQWRVEDVEIPNPNHFAEVAGLGGGFLSSLSSNVLGNSDFFIGAFPSEYNNAVSGVFDIKMRNGNNQKYQQTFQLGMLGIDFASEGPISKKHNSSYIVNYRYSTTGLLEKLRKDNSGGVLDYQDLNFKVNFPTKNAGIFSLWGTGMIDEATPIVDDASDWNYKDDAVGSGAKQKAGASGISHRYFFGNHQTSLKTTLAATYAENIADEMVFDSSSNNKTLQLYMDGKTKNFVLTSALSHKFNAHHTNKTGVTATYIDYDMNLDYAPIFGQPLMNIINSKGNTNLISAYTSSLLNIGNGLTMNLGINGQILTLNNSKTIEPRAGMKWQASSKSLFSIGYGLHSRMEKPDVYFVKDKDGNLPNKDLGFTKSHHFMLGYTYQISEDMCFKIEPYFQLLYNVPVIADGSYSILNRNDYYVTETLVSKGEGRNYGVDLTFEKYFTRGLYYMVTASIFDSKYRAGNGNWYNTRYNRNFMVNGLIGKEWLLGHNMLSVNLRASVLGGQRYTPVDEAATWEHPDKEVQYDESKMYSEQFSPMFIASFSISYKMNRKNVAHEFAIKGVNATNQKEYIEHRYNIRTNVIEPYMSANSLFNVSYRLEF